MLKQNNGKFKSFKNGEELREEDRAAEDRNKEILHTYTTSQQPERGRAGFAEHFCHRKHLGLP